LLDPEFPLPSWSKTAAAVTAAMSEAEPPLSDAATAAGDAAIAFAEAIMDGLPAESTGPASGASGAAGDVVEPVVFTAPALEPVFPAAEELAASLRENHAALQAFYEAAGERPQETVIEPAANSTAAPSAGASPAAASPAVVIEHRPGLVPAPEGLAPLEQVVGLSSLEHAGKDVLLEVNAEIHIYGRSTPNTELTLYGQVVRTRPDGTFSVRRPLPHGALILPMLYTRNAP
jgi:hypothetical protein